MQRKITIAITDDHQLFLKSLILMVESFENFSIVADALNGKILIEKLKSLIEKPDIVLLDVNMPVMDGPATAQYIYTHYPEIKIVALSMNDDHKSIIKMIKAGACAYLLKDMHPNELEKALNHVAEKGYYNLDSTNISMRKFIAAPEQTDSLLSEKELKFLKLACSELTYQVIASQMGVSERTIDGYRESVFLKLNVGTRVGMILEAVRKKLIVIE